MSECEVCGMKAEREAYAHTEVCGHVVCLGCYGVIADMVDGLFGDPAALRAVREHADDREDRARTWLSAKEVRR